jgi:hypothetical protein
MNRNKILFALVPGMILVVLAAAIVTRATSTPITNGIVGWWQFNELSGITASDSSGPYDNGTYTNGMLVGSALFTTDATRGAVLNVYGISGYVEYPYTTTLQPATGTISVWVKPSSLVLADIVQQDTDLICNLSANLTAYALRMDPKGRAYAVISNGNPKTCAKNPQTQAYSSSGQLAVNQWTHLAMEWNGTTLYLFVNGKQVSSTSYYAEPTYGLSYHGTSPMKVAGIGVLGNNYEGELSDLRIYSRALTSTEIAQIYNGQ